MLPAALQAASPLRHALALAPMLTSAMSLIESPQHAADGHHCVSTAPVQLAGY